VSQADTYLQRDPAIIEPSAVYLEKKLAHYRWILAAESVARAIRDEI
jgi:hypothetical protein